MYLNSLHVLLKINLECNGFFLDLEQIVIGQTCNSSDPDGRVNLNTNIKFKKMKKIYFLLITKLLLLGLVNSSFGQTGLKRWYFNGNEVDFSTGVPQVNPLPASALNPNSATHGMYGNNGKPLFQVIDGKIYNKVGNLVADFHTASFPAQPTFLFSPRSEYGYETEIIPVPGSECSKFYVFYLQAIFSTTGLGAPPFHGHILRYSEYDLTLNNGQGGLNPSITNQYLIDYQFDGYPSLTVQKSDLQGNYRLYVAGSKNKTMPNNQTEVYRINVTSSGVSSPVFIWGSEEPIETCELEISPDGTKLAFANLKPLSGRTSTNDLVILNLDASGNLITHQIYNLPGSNEQRFTGVEFHPNGNNLYVGATGVGIYNVLLSNGSSSIISNSADYGNSHLELAYHPVNSDLVFAFRNDGILGSFNISTNLFNTATLTGVNGVLSGTINSNPHRPLVYVLPDQIDGYDYDQLFQQSNPVCCETLRGFNVFNYTATTSATWSPSSNPISNGGIIDILDELRIVSGTTVTLQNMQFNFGANGKVIVEQNARLILDSTEFTSTDCNVLWRGIEVWGNFNQHQYPTAGNRFQGYLEIKNGSSIKNANNAIQLWKPGDYNTSGGVVYASNSSFINNRRTAEFISYENFLPSNPAIKTNYFSSFVNCTFELNNQINGPTNFGAFVTMWEVRGIGFSGCRFLNNASQFTTNQVGHAIYSIDANYTVTDFCPTGISPCNTTPIRSEFNNLNTAIEALGATSNRPFNVFNSKFEGNRNSIINDQVNFCRIVNNDFLFQPYAVAGTKTGIYIHQATGFEVIHNRFNSEEDISIENHGIVTNNTGSAANELYANQFYDIKRAVWAVQDNRGLLYGCNHFERCARDILIQQDGVYQIQAYGNLSAGNSFSQISAPDGDLRNGSTQGMKYYHHGGQSEPIYYTPSTVSLQTLSANNCPSRLNTGGVVSAMKSNSELSALKDDFNQSFNQLITAKYNYGQLIDGGNSAQLLQQVVNTWSDEVWMARQELLNQSPYLSQEFLIDLANSNSLPQAILLEVILANPEATFNEDFLVYLQYEAPQPFSELQIQLIMESWDNPTPRASIERLIASARQNCVSLANIVVRHYLADTTINTIDSLNAWLAVGHWFEYELATVNESLLVGDFEEVNGTLQSLQLQFESEYEQASINRMLSLAAILENISAYAENYYEMNEQDENILLEFALFENDLAAAKAKNILKFYKNHEFPSDIPMEGEFRKAGKLPTKSKGLNSTNLKAYPNPAKDFVNFKMAGWHEVSTLMIYNAQGQMIQQIEIKPTGEIYMLNTSNWPSGLYQYRLTKSNETIGSGKIMITK